MKAKRLCITICIAIFSTVFFCGARNPGSASNEKWEYLIVSHMKLAGMESESELKEKCFQAMSTLKGAQFVNTEVSDRMTRLGEQGWELVCYGKEIGFVFKRLK